MFGTMKKAMVIAAVAGVSALAPAMASGATWEVGGVDYTGTGLGTGQLTLTVTANGATTTCDVEATLDLNNSGGVAGGTVTDFQLGANAGGDCSTSLPNCAVTAAANPASLPWTIGTSGSSATISGIAFQNTYVNDGGTCALNGVPVTATGSITGSVSGDTITFSGAGPLSSTFGPATVSGSVTVETTSGVPIVLT